MPAGPIVDGGRQLQLAQAEAALSAIADEVDALYATCRPTEDLLELRNLYLVAQLIVRSAQQRKESRGLHFNTDYPEPRESERHDTVLVKERREGHKRPAMAVVHS